ncbi:uncharacterized protein LOC123684939 [Harmonia axyridis]|uniref:uncharacterized protein LOC123684939 n=1 Tax=Harmonia axyridis TaxID=115357 RepID=UPI001E279A71|nr:uncharacterized protein LOC123684939 [Harmonia axyridis]
MMNHRHAASIAAIYFLNISFMVVLFYSWRVSYNLKRVADLKDVYYGVQFAYCAIIGTHLLMFILNIHLYICIYKVNLSLINLWTVSFLALLALEAVLMIYSNILRDHVNRKFDDLCEFEVFFFSIRLVFSVIAVRFVTLFGNQYRMGMDWKERETIQL